MSKRLERVYGAGPTTLLGTLAALSVSGAALVHFVASGPLIAVAVWFAGAIALHDLVLFPAYTLLDRRAARRLGQAINYVRVPTLLSALLGLVWFPLILRLGDTRYRRASGMDTHLFLGRWLAISAALFAGSALAYALNYTRRRRN